MTILTTRVGVSGTDLHRAVAAWQRAPRGFVERVGLFLWNRAPGTAIEVQMDGPASSRLTLTGNGPLGRICVPVARRSIIRRSEHVRHFGTRSGASTVPMKCLATRRPDGT